MISRKNGFGLGVALSVASVCLTFNVPVLAQDTAPQTEEKTEGSASASVDATLGGSADAEATADADADPLAAPGADSEQSPAAEPEEQSEPEAEPKEEKAEADAKPAAKKSDKAAADASAAPMGPVPNTSSPAYIRMLPIEELPGTAYPSIQVRGLTFGSLWRTFHGQQWPYLPQTEKGQNLRIGLSGYMWNDLSNTRIAVDKSLAGANVNNQNRFVTQTRGILRVTPTINADDGWFVQGNGEIVVQGDMRPDPATGVATTTDDVWVRFGKWNTFDFTFGRFQAWEIANHYGMALDWATLERQGAWIVSSSLPRPTDGYGLSYFWDRQNFLLGTYAFHVYPTKYLRGELLGHIGAGNSSNAANPYQMDVRPSVIFDVGWLKLKGGWEYGKATPQDAKQKVRDSKNGFGFAAQFVFDPYIEFGGSFARGFQDVLDKDAQVDLNASNTVQTFGGFMNVSPGYTPVVIGVGAFWNHWEDFRIDNNVGPHHGKVDTNDQQLMFGAVQYNMFTRLYLKFVFSYARNEVEHFNANAGTPYTNTALSGRFRTEFLF